MKGLDTVIIATFWHWALYMVGLVGGKSSNDPLVREAEDSEDQRASS